MMSNSDLLTWCAEQRAIAEAALERGHEWGQNGICPTCKGPVRITYPLIWYDLHNGVKIPSNLPQMTNTATAGDPTTVALMLAVIEAATEVNEINLPAEVEMLTDAVEAPCYAMSAALDALREHVGRERAGE